MLIYGIFPIIWNISNICAVKKGEGLSLTIGVKKYGNFKNAIT
tara:strand:+ start:71644 stop:71772 length:129 start_codon:yes stop_codon:yes gene_type:complete